MILPVDVFIMVRASSPIPRDGPNEWLEVLLRHKKDLSARFRSRVVRSLDVPPYLYGAFWKSIVLDEQPAKVTSKEYTALLNSEEFKFQSEIKRDINRTFPSLRFFMELNSLGQTQLYNVLKAYSIFNPEVGYCQGMGFIVGMLLSHMDEVDAFNVLVVLMDKNGEFNMQGLYKPGLPLLNEYLRELDKMIQVELPKLADHFLALGIETSMFASQWILTLLVYNLDWSEAKKMFNLFLILKIDVVLKFTLYILHRAQTQLLTMGFEEILGRVNDMGSVKVSEFLEWLHSREKDDSNVEKDSGSSDSIDSD